MDDILWKDVIHVECGDSSLFSILGPDSTFVFSISPAGISRSHLAAENLVRNPPLLTGLSFLLISLPVFYVTTSPLNRPVSKSSSSWWTHGRLGGSGGYLIVSKVHVTTVFCICLITFGEALGQLNKSMKCHLKFCVRKCCVSKGIEFANNREWCTMEPMG